MEVIQDASQKALHTVTVQEIFPGIVQVITRVSHLKREYFEGGQKGTTKRFIFAFIFNNPRNFWVPLCTIMQHFQDTAVITLRPTSQVKFHQSFKNCSNVKNCNSDCIH